MCRCAPLAAAVQVEAQAWVRGIMEVMAETDTPQLEGLRQQARKGGAMRGMALRAGCTCRPTPERRYVMSQAEHLGKPCMSGPRPTPARLQATALLAAVRQQPEEGAEGVDGILQATVAAQASASAAAVSCAELAERCRARWAYVVPTDKASMRAELASIAEVAAAWEVLLAAAAAAREHCTHLHDTTRRFSLAASEVGAAASTEESRGSRRRGSIMAGANHGAMQRTASSASTAASASIKARERGGGAALGKRGTSRQAS